MAVSTGSRLKKAQSEKSFCCFRGRRKSRRHQHLPPPGNIHPKKSVEDVIELADGFVYTTNGYGGPVHQARNTDRGQAENSSYDILEELVHETDYKIYRVKVQVHQTDATIQHKSQIFNEDIVEELVNGFNYSTVLDKGKVLQSTDTSTWCSEGAAELSVKLQEACRMRALQEGALKMLAEFVTPAIQGGNVSHLSTFGTMHPSFSRAPVLLDVLLTRSDTIRIFRTPEGLPANNGNGHSSRNQMKRAMASTVGTWPEQVQGFGKPSLCLSLFHLKQALVQVNVPTSQQLCQAPLLCVDLEYPEFQNATPEDLPAELGHTAQSQEGPPEGLVPFSARGLALARPGMKQYQKPGCRHLCNQHILRELLNNFNYSTSLDKWKTHEANDTRQCLPEKSNQDFTAELADCFTYAISLYKSMQSILSQQGHQLWPYSSPHSPTTMRSNSDIIHQLVDRSHSNFYQKTVQVHQANTVVQCRSKSSNSDIVHQLIHEYHYNYYGERVQVHQTDTIVLCWSKKSNGDIIHQLIHESTYNIYLDRVQVNQANTTIQCWSKALKGGTLKKVADVVAPAFLGGNICHLTTFKSMCQAFSRAQMFLDNPLSRSETIKVFSAPEGLPAYNENRLSPRAIASTGETWPDQVQVFGQALRSSLFQLKQALVKVSSPTSRQLCEAQLLWVKLEYPKPKDAMPEALLPEFESNAHPQEVHAHWLVPDPTRGLVLAWTGLMQCLKPGWSLLLCFLFLAILGVLSFILNK